MEILHNDHLSRYPHMEGVWPEQGVIIGRWEPSLFILSGHEMFTWKEGINGED